MFKEDKRDNFRPHTEGEGKGGPLRPHVQLGAVTRRYQPPPDKVLKDTLNSFLSTFHQAIFLVQAD